MFLAHLEGIFNAFFEVTKLSRSYYITGFYTSSVEDPLICTTVEPQSLLICDDQIMSELKGIKKKKIMELWNAESK